MLTFNPTADPTAESGSSSAKPAGNGEDDEESSDLESEQSQEPERPGGIAEMAAQLLESWSSLKVRLWNYGKCCIAVRPVHLAWIGVF